MNPSRRHDLIQTLAELDQVVAESQAILNECPTDHDIYFQAMDQLRDAEETRCKVERMLEVMDGRAKK